MPAAQLEDAAGEQIGSADATPMTLYVARAAQIKAVPADCQQPSDEDVESEGLTMAITVTQQWPRGAGRRSLAPSRQSR